MRLHGLLRRLRSACAATAATPTPPIARCTFRTRRTFGTLLLFLLLLLLLRLRLRLSLRTLLALLLTIAPVSLLELLHLPLHELARAGIQLHT